MAAEEDTNPPSARGYVQVDTATFHWSPAQPGTDGHHHGAGGPGPGAPLCPHRHRSEPTGQGRWAQVAAMVPVILTPPDASLVEAGQITDVTVRMVPRASPSRSLTTFQNTGTNTLRWGTASRQRHAGSRHRTRGDPRRETFGASRKAGGYRHHRGLLDWIRRCRPAATASRSVITDEHGAPLDILPPPFEMRAAYEPFPRIARERHNTVLFDERAGRLRCPQRTRC